MRHPTNSGPGPAPTDGVRTRRGVVLGLAGAAAAVAAPGAAQAFYRGETGGAARPIPASSDMVVVAMNDRLRYVPDMVRIKVGDTVEWRNVQSFPHTVTADPAKVRNRRNVELPEGAAPFDSGRIGAGGAWRLTFTVPGTYRYVCLPHEGRGMLGTVIVE